MWIYDFEVFKYDWLVVFKNIQTHEKVYIENNSDKLKSFYKRIKGQLLIGFNCARYDDYIFQAILSDVDPYRISKYIIEDNDLMPVFRLINSREYPIVSLDLSLDASYSSLKSIEGYLMMNIEESEIDFNIDRPLTRQELDSVKGYCEHDVDATEEFAILNAKNMKEKIGLVSQFKLAKTDIKKSNASLTAKILGARKTKNRNDELEPYSPVDCLDINDYIDVLEFYTKCDYIDYTKSMKIDIYGVPHVFAYGGIHGALKNFTYSGRMLMLDVTSYYPSMMKNFNFHSRNIPEKSKELFNKIYYDRVKLKDEGRKEEANILKLVLNTIFGCLKYEQNPLFDPKMSNNICITGQLLLLDLIEKIHHCCDLVQSNTDGILVIPHENKEAELLAIVAEWEERTGLSMERDVVKRIAQKDVNNYIIEFEDGKIKTKGGMTSQISHSFKHTLRILHEAVVEYFINGVPVEDTINQCQDLRKFQIITNTGRTYEETNWIYDGRVIPIQKVNRFYASTDKLCGKPYKVKKVEKNGLVDYSNNALIGNCPDYPMLDNICEFDIADLDREWYIEQANDRVKKYKGKG